MMRFYYFPGKVVAEERLCYQNVNNHRHIERM